jgi:hypothetical protein
MTAPSLASPVSAAGGLCILVVGIALALVLPAPSGAASDRATTVASAERVPPLWRNCTAVNRRYPHGVGRRRARDKTSGDPVTNFRRSNALYRTAMRHNRGLDRDKDGIACEKK